MDYRDKLTPEEAAELAELGAANERHRFAAAAATARAERLRDRARKRIKS